MFKIIKRVKKIVKGMTFFDRILASLVILGVCLFAYIFSRQSSYITATLKVDKNDVYYSRFSEGVPAWFDNFFYKGMTEKNGLGTVQAQVLDVNSYFIKPEALSLYLKTRLRVTYNRASNQYTYKGSPVVIGTRLKLYLDGVLVDGLVTLIDGVEDTRERKILVVETKIVDENSTYLNTSGTEEYLADAINVGDEIKDTQGNTVIKVLAKRAEPAKRITTSSDGSLRVFPDPVRKDVYLTLEMNAIKIHDRYFIFDDVAVLVDNQLSLNFATALVVPTITKIVDTK